MKYIVITSKHHDGFAMYHSKACDFNIVDATPWKKDPMKELAAACREEGLGFGFYYSHNQDWTFPGGGNGPKTDADGNPATFDDYFVKKCLPQVKEITSEYGPIEIVWFDTPGKMPKKYVEQLVEVVRKNQPHALVSGRAGHDLGDYQTLGDMEVPRRNIEGMWESVDTTNDSWAYAWYDEYWKSPKEILHRLIACVGRGGTYMLNIGPRGDGTVPERAARSLREAGEWIRRYPQVVYGTDASPWQHALPWGDVTRKGNKLFLAVFEWPASGKLYLPGLKTPITSARLLKGDQSEAIDHETSAGWTILQLPPRAPEKLVSVIELECDGPPEADPVWGIDPNIGTEILAEFATVEGAEQAEKRWMEKFGEWKGVVRVHRLAARRQGHLGSQRPGTGRLLRPSHLLRRRPSCVGRRHRRRRAHPEPAEFVAQLSGVPHRLDQLPQARQVPGKCVVPGRGDEDGKSQGNSFRSCPVTANPMLASFPRLHSENWNACDSFKACGGKIADGIAARRGAILPLAAVPGSAFGTAVVELD